MQKQNKKQTVVIADYDYGNVDIERAIIEGAGFELVAAQCKSEDDVIKVAKDADAIVTQYATVGAKAINALTRCRVIARNVRYVDGELDIVALDRADVLVFIEVRTRSSEDFGAPEESIRRGKRERVRRAARRFIRERRLQTLTPRFDTAAVVWPPEGKPEIRYHENAFGMRE